MLEAILPARAIEVVEIAPSGDRIQDKPLHEMGGKGLFTKELELALLAGRIDGAVHSMKDVPVTMPLVDVSTLVIAAIPRREDPRDVLVSVGASSIGSLPERARVGTGSLRRAVQLRAIRADVTIEPIRGNIDTRLGKLRDGAFDAIVLAAAGLNRAGMFDPTTMACIDIDQMVPAAGQGALAVQCRSSDAEVVQWLGLIDDAETRRCVEIEREVVRLLSCDCHSPVGVLARPDDRVLQIHAAWHNGHEMRRVTDLDVRNDVHLAAVAIARGLSDISA